jgi:hypothetical protein
MGNDTPEARAMRARIAAYTLHASCNSTEHTAPARAASPGSLSYWEREVDPEGMLMDDERRRRAECALKAHMTRLALASAKARARRAGGERRG